MERNFFVFWSVTWIGIFASIIVSKAYESWGDYGYLTCGLVLTLPNTFIPILFPGEADRKLPWHKRFITKANIFIACVNFTGNYFWTHYFFSLLGASYTFPVTWKLNGIPIALYMITQSYFTTYFLTSNLMIRQINQRTTPGYSRTLILALSICALSWFFAFMETWTIESVPYYSFLDRDQMYKVGLTFYALYFVPTFPIFYWIDEEVNSCWNFSEALVHGLASSLLAFYLVDFWRLLVGNISSSTSQSTLPFV